MKSRNVWVFILVSLVSGWVHADTLALAKDTLEDGKHVFTSPMRLTRDDIPMLLGVTAAIGGSMALDKVTYRNLYPYKDSGAADSLRKFGDVAQFSGPILGGAFGMSGWARDDDRQKQIGWDLIDSFLWANAVSGVFKFTLGRRRPSATDDPFDFRPGSLHNSSFPSGHTTSAFAAAAMLSAYYPTWTVAVPAYATASAVGFSRIYANYHWGSDVVGGALIGIGVSRAIWKRHHARSQNSWTFGVGPEGFRVTRTF